jgi:hypothetical protein
MFQVHRQVSSVARHRVALGEPFLDMQNHPDPHGEREPQHLTYRDGAQQSHIPFSENMDRLIDLLHDVIGPLPMLSPAHQVEQAADIPSICHFFRRQLGVLGFACSADVVLH